MVMCMSKWYVFQGSSLKNYIKEFILLTTYLHHLLTKKQGKNKAGSVVQRIAPATSSHTFLLGKVVT